MALLRGINVNNITALKRHGLSVSAIREEAGFDRKTLRKYLQDITMPVYGPQGPRPVCSSV